MPVSPADFEFYSRVTGIPIPNDPVARMRMAPQVYAMRRGPMSRVKDALGAAAKAALVGGAVVGTGLLAKEAANRMGGSGAAQDVSKDDDINISLERSGQSAPAEGPKMSVTTPSPEDVNVSATYSRPPAVELSPEIDVSTPSTRDRAESLIRDVTQNYTFDSGDALIGTAATPEEVAAFRQRISHQTEVPQADPNLANESFDAQRASVGEPVESLTTGRPEQAAPGLDNVLAQAYEFYEAGEGARSATGKLLTPFQLKGAPQELSGHSRTRNREVKQFFDQYGIPLGSVPEKLRGGVASYLKNRGSDPAATPAQSEPAMRMAGSTFTTQIPGSSAVASVTLDPQNPEYMGIAYGKTPDKTYGQAVTPTFGRAVMSQMDRLSDPAQSEMEQSEMGSFGKMISGMKKSGAMTKEGTSAPELLPGARPVFVTDKGIEVGNTLARAQEKEESKVTLGEIGQAALNVVKAAVTGKSAKRAARSAELDRTFAKGLGNLSPEQRAEKRDEILRKEGY